MQEQFSAEREVISQTLERPSAIGSSRGAQYRMYWVRLRRRLFVSGVLRPRPRVTFSCCVQEKVAKEKDTPDGSLSPVLRTFALSLAHGTSLYRGEARNPSAPLRAHGQRLSMLGSAIRG
mgnify:FL=1